MLHIGGVIIFTTRQLLEECKSITDELTTIQKKIQSFPKGKLICARNDSRCKWYQSDGHNKAYIPKKNRALAEQLAAKRYYILRAEALRRKKNAINAYLRHYPSISPEEQLLADSPYYHELLAPYFKLPDQILQDWVNSPYDTNPKYTEYLIHKTVSGHLVRSKSEALIDTLLYTSHIPFRYECALNLNGITVYPDFTILHPQTKQLYYWEHFGQMDDSSYSKQVPSKLQLYISAGIIPDIQLITTYETQKHPLTAEYIEHIVKYHFL